MCMHSHAADICSARATGRCVPAQSNMLQPRMGCKLQIASLATGEGVKKIEGDQASQAIFSFEGGIDGCDREVAFTCVNGEWRAEG